MSEFIIRYLRRYYALCIMNSIDEQVPTNTAAALNAMPLYGSGRVLFIVSLKTLHTLKFDWVPIFLISATRQAFVRAVCWCVAWLWLNLFLLASCHRLPASTTPRNTLKMMRQKVTTVEVRQWQNKVGVAIGLGRVAGTRSSPPPAVNGCVSWLVNNVHLSNEAVIWTCIAVLRYGIYVVLRVARDIAINDSVIRSLVSFCSNKWRASSVMHFVVI